MSPHVDFKYVGLTRRSCASHQLITHRVLARRGRPPLFLWFTSAVICAATWFLMHIVLSRSLWVWKAGLNQDGAGVGSCMRLRTLLRPLDCWDLPAGLKFVSSDSSCLLFCQCFSGRRPIHWASTLFFFDHLLTLHYLWLDVPSMSPVGIRMLPNGPTVERLECCLSARA